MQTDSLSFSARPASLHEVDRRDVPRPGGSSFRSILKDACVPKDAGDTPPSSPLTVEDDAAAATPSEEAEGDTAAVPSEAAETAETPGDNRDDAASVPAESVSVPSPAAVETAPTPNPETVEPPSPSSPAPAPEDDAPSAAAKLARGTLHRPPVPVTTRSPTAPSALPTSPDPAQTPSPDTPPPLSLTHVPAAAPAEGTRHPAGRDVPIAASSPVADRPVAPEARPPAPTGASPAAAPVPTNAEPGEHAAMPAPGVDAAAVPPSDAGPAEGQRVPRGDSSTGTPAAEEQAGAARTELPGQAVRFEPAAATSERPSNRKGEANERAAEPAADPPPTGSPADEATSLLDVVDAPPEAAITEEAPAPNVATDPPAPAPEPSTHGAAETPSTSRAGTHPAAGAERGGAARAAVSAAWLRTTFAQTLPSVSVEDGWKVLEMELEEGQGTMTVKARRDEDRVAVSVGFSDPNLRALAQTHADRLEQVLRTQYEANVDFSLFSGQSETPDRRPGASREGGALPGSPGAATPPADASRAARVALSGASNEWIG